MADGWRNRADAMEIFGSPIPSGLEAIGKAIEIDRQLLVASASTANRLALAYSLRLEGDSFRAAALCSNGAESTSAYRHSRDCYAEVLGILTSLKHSDQLPRDAGLIALTSHLADAGERLREGNDQRVLSSR